MGVDSIEIVEYICKFLGLGIDDKAVEWFKSWFRSVVQSKEG